MVDPTPRVNRMIVPLCEHVWTKDIRCFRVRCKKCYFQINVRDLVMRERVYLDAVGTTGCKVTSEVRR